MPSEILREYARLRRLAFPEKFRAANRRFYKSEKGAAKFARYRKSRSYKIVQNKYRTSSKGKTYTCLSAARRRAKIGREDLETGAIFTEIRLTPILSCSWCGMLTTPEERHVDHIIALALGGAHAAHNLTGACCECNHRKSAKSLDKWLEEIS